MTEYTYTDNEGPVRFRRARWSDALFLFKLASDPEVRRHSLDKRKPTLRGHLRWMRRMLDEHLLLVVVINGLRAGVFSGQLRYIVRRNEAVRSAVVGVSLAREFRGCGNGTLVIDEGSAEVALEMGCECLTAVIATENVASTMAFSKAGYLASLATQEVTKAADGSLGVTEILVMQKEYPWGMPR